MIPNPPTQKHVRVTNFETPGPTKKIIANTKLASPRSPGCKKTPQMSFGWSCPPFYPAYHKGLCLHHQGWSQNEGQQLWVYAQKLHFCICFQCISRVDITKISSHAGLVLIDATAEVLLRLYLAWWTRYHYHPRKESISHQARKSKSSTQECFGKGYVILPNKVPLNTCRCSWILTAYQNHGMKMILPPGSLT